MVIQKIHAEKSCNKTTKGKTEKLDDAEGLLLSNSVL